MDWMLLEIPQVWSHSVNLTSPPQSHLHFLISRKKTAILTNKYALCARIISVVNMAYFQYERLSNVNTVIISYQDLLFKGGKKLILYLMVASQYHCYIVLQTFYAMSTSSAALDLRSSATQEDKHISTDVSRLWGFCIGGLRLILILVEHIMFQDKNFLSHLNNSHQIMWIPNI